MTIAPSLARRAAAGAATALYVACAAPTLSAQISPTPGPVILSGGAVFDVVSPTFTTPLNHDYRVVFEIVNGVATEEAAGGAGTAAGNPPAARRAPNQQLNTVARFLNMQVRAGVPRERIQLAAVIHGSAGKDMLDDATYRERYGTDNPSGPLIRELLSAGVRVVLCGQTAAGRDIPTNRLIPGVQVALSAMTAMTVLQSNGYTFNPW